jgi:NAD(P)-dependent dehydrogenase (short-subunit alcohol dehydrogenase family)
MTESPIPPTSPTYPDLKGKVALITGIGQVPAAASALFGNGAATALLLAHNGCHIFGCDLSLEAAQKTASLIEGIGGSCDVMVADVTSSSDVKKVVDACMAKHGRVDILVNNVGRSAPGGPAEMDEKTWDLQIDVNLKSVYLCTHHVLPIMEKQGCGAVVSVASIAGMRYIGKPQVAYAASKAGVMQFTKATAVLYASRGVRLNVVVPGLMHTPLVELLAEKYAGGDYDGFVKTRHAQVPTGKMGDAFDVGQAICFLCSNGAKYITGQKLVIDGGITSSTGRT